MDDKHYYDILLNEYHRQQQKGKYEYSPKKYETDFEFDYSKKWVYNEIKKEKKVVERKKTTKEILDTLPFAEIEKYVRMKKLEKLKKIAAQ